MQNPYIPNILFVGSSCVGKTTLIGKLSGHYIDTGVSRPTIKSDFVLRQFKIGKSSNQVTVDARLYDQQSSISASPPSIMRHKDIIVLMWSLVDMESFRKLDQHLKTILSIFDTSYLSQPSIVLCANKCDSGERDSEYKLCCGKYNQYQNVKLSAVSGTGIREFESIICDILLKRYNERTDNQLRDDTVVVGYDPDKDNPDKDNPDPCC